MKIVSKATGVTRSATLISTCSNRKFNLWRVKHADGSTRPMFQKDIVRRWKMVIGE